MIRVEDKLKTSLVAYPKWDDLIFLFFFTHSFLFLSFAYVPYILFVFIHVNWIYITLHFVDLISYLTREIETRGGKKWVLEGVQKSFPKNYILFLSWLVEICLWSFPKNECCFYTLSTPNLGRVKSLCSVWPSSVSVALPFDLLLLLTKGEDA